MLFYPATLFAIVDIATAAVFPLQLLRLVLEGLLYPRVVGAASGNLSE